MPARPAPYASDPAFVHRLALLRVKPLRFAFTSRPSRCEEDLHLLADKLARHRQKRPQSAGGAFVIQDFCDLLLCSRLGVGVVLFVVNVLRSGVLLFVDLLLLALCQLSAVCRAVRLHLLVDALLLILEFGGLARGELPALDSLGDAVLLVFAALANRIVSIVRRVRVVLVLINLL